MFFSPNVNYNFVESWVLSLTSTPVMMLMTCAAALIAAGVMRPASVRLRSSQR